VPFARLHVCLQSVGIGQLFRHLDTLPAFTLLSVGRQGTEPEAGALASLEGGEGTPDDMSGVWRVYDLESTHLSCRIQERFVRDLFELPV
jgi:hypothetical protein